MIRIFVHVGTEPGVEILKFLSGKSLDLAIRGDSFASETNEKVSAPGTPAGNTGQSRAVLSPEAVSTRRPEGAAADRPVPRLPELCP